MGSLPCMQGHPCAVKLSFSFWVLPSAHAARLTFCWMDAESKKSTPFFLPDRLARYKSVSIKSDAFVLE